MGLAFGSDDFLICRSDTTLYAIPLAHVVETMRPLPVEQVANMPAFVLGLSIIRGEGVPVLDTALLVCGRSGTQHARYVTIRIDVRTACLAVGDVVGIRNVPPTLRAGIPHLLQASHADIVTAIGILDAELLVVLQSARLISEELWYAINTRGEPLGHDQPA